VTGKFQTVATTLPLCYVMSTPTTMQQIVNHSALQSGKDLVIYNHKPNYPLIQTLEIIFIKKK